MRKLDGLYRRCGTQIGKIHNGYFIESKVVDNTGEFIGYIVIDTKSESKLEGCYNAYIMKEGEAVDIIRNVGSIVRRVYNRCEMHYLVKSFSFMGVNVLWEYLDVITGEKVLDDRQLGNGISNDDVWMCGYRQKVLSVVQDKGGGDIKRVKDFGGKYNRIIDNMIIGYMDGAPRVKVECELVYKDAQKAGIHNDECSNFANRLGYLFTNIDSRAIMQYNRNIKPGEQFVMYIRESTIQDMLKVIIVNGRIVESSITGRPYIISIDKSRIPKVPVMDIGPDGNWYVIDKFRGLNF